jgi:hemerythrin-like domain-containing protein
MRRDPSLIPLSHQHHNGLALCVLTDRVLASDTSPANVEKLGRRIVDRFEIELVNHFELEEQLVFPLLGQESTLVAELIAEHRIIERIVATLREQPSIDALREFTAVLRRHIRTEENELFEQIQKAIPREELDRVGEELERRAVRVCL